MCLNVLFDFQKWQQNEAQQLPKGKVREFPERFDKLFWKKQTSVGMGLEHTKCGTSSGAKGIYKNKGQ